MEHYIKELTLAVKQEWIIHSLLLEEKLYTL
mgnify:CR=1 FL=1